MRIGDPPVVHLVYLATDGGTASFEWFLREHARLLSALPAWVIVVAHEARKVSRSDGRERGGPHGYRRWPGNWTRQHVGGVGTCVPELRLFLRVLTSERWGENEGLGTVRKLDRVTDLFSVT